MPPIIEKPSVFSSISTALLTAIGSSQPSPAPTASVDPETHDSPPWDGSDLWETSQFWAPLVWHNDPMFKRTSFGSWGHATVYGWPSTGGFLIAYCDGVELDFLGLSRFKSVPRPKDPAEEDAHCVKLRKLGAKWWNSERDRAEHDISCSSEDYWEEDFLMFGWPSSGGGVWVLKLRQQDACSRGVGRIYNAKTMDERCAWMEKLGATFYADPDDCPDLDLHGKLENYVKPNPPCARCEMGWGHHVA